MIFLYLRKSFFFFIYLTTTSLTDMTIHFYSRTLRYLNIRDFYINNCFEFVPQNRKTSFNLYRAIIIIIVIIVLRIIIIIILSLCTHTLVSFAVNKYSNFTKTTVWPLPMR